MSFHIWRCHTETDRGKMASGFCIHIELWKLVLDFTVAWG